MQYDIGYTTFEGASGNARVTRELLPEWLADRPGTVIRSIERLGESMSVSEGFKRIRQQALKEFAEGILRNLS